jgi:hypothetical protein
LKQTIHHISTQSCVEIKCSAVQVKLSSNLCSYELTNDEHVECVCRIPSKIYRQSKGKSFLEAKEQQLLDPLFIAHNPWASTEKRDQWLKQYFKNCETQNARWIDKKSVVPLAVDQIKEMELLMQIHKHCQQAITCLPLMKSEHIKQV